MKARSPHPIFAALYDRMMRLPDWLGFREQRARTTIGARGRTLELGAGTGLNFEHYSSGVSDLVALEPDPAMLARAVTRARSAPCPVRLLLGDGQRLPFRDASFDSVVITLVLCTVPDVAAALAELRRVLRAGGELHFFEHVRASSHFGARLQDLVTPAWRHIAGGCHLNRDTLATFARLGLTTERLWQRGTLIQGMARFA